MGCCKFFIFFSTFTVLLLAVGLYQPVHEDLYDKGLMRFVLAIEQIFTCLADLSEYVGYNKYVTMRVLMDYANSVKEPLEDGIQERQETFNGVNVHIFEPTEPSSALRPGLIYVHGGGYFSGSSDMCRMLLDVLAKRLQAVVVSVDYRLAPEYHHPAQHNDVMTVVNYVGENAEKLGVNPKHIGIAGESAGATLAAAATLKLRDTSSPVKLRYQLLLYPIVQGLTLDLPSHNTNEWHTFRMTRKASLAASIAMYIGADSRLSKYIEVGNHTSPEIWKEFGHLVDPKLLPPESAPKDYSPKNFGATRLEPKNHVISKESMQNLIDPYAFPLMAKSLENLPPAFVLTCKLDPVRDEGILYAQRLKQDGNRVEHYADTYGMHGNILMCKGPLVPRAATEAVNAVVNFVKKQ